MIGKQDSRSIKNAFVTYETDENMKTKPITSIAMTGIIVIAALLVSGLSLLSSYQQQVIAQEELTGGAGGTTAGGTEGATAGGGNATTTAAGGGNQTTSEVRLHLEEARTALQNGDTEAALMHLDLALNQLGGGTEGNMTSTTGATNSTAELATQGR